MTREGLQRFQQQLVGLVYRPAFQGATKQFKATQDNVRLEILCTGEYPGDGLPKPVAFPHPNDFFEEIDGSRRHP